MSTSTRRQLERLKADFEQIKPKEPKPIRLVALPGPNASEAKRATYAEAVAWSKAQGGGGINLIVLVGVVPGAHVQDSASVVHVESEAQAQLMLASLQPSEHGRASRLDDVLNDLSGNVVGVGCVMNT